MAEIKKWRVTTKTTAIYGTTVEAETAEEAIKECENGGYIDFKWHEEDGELPTKFKARPLKEGEW